MVIQAILVGILYWLSMGRASYFISFAFRKPVVLGVFIGLVYGDVQTGQLYGATIQLMYMGGIEAGGNIPSDQGLATCIAIPAAIANNLDPAAAVALAVPFGVLGVLINNVRRTINSFYNTKADKFVEDKQYDKLSIFSFVLPWLTNGVVFYTGIHCDVIRFQRCTGIYQRDTGMGDEWTYQRRKHAAGVRVRTDTGCYGKKEISAILRTGILPVLCHGLLHADRSSDCIMSCTDRIPIQTER